MCIISLSLSPLSLSLPLSRRLSSKKRKKVASQQQGGDGSSSGSSDQQQSSSSHSPMGSANGSPAVTSTTYTPPAFDKRLVCSIYIYIYIVCIYFIWSDSLSVLNMVTLHSHGVSRLLLVGMVRTCTYM